MSMQEKVAGRRFQKRLDAMVNRSENFKTNFQPAEPIYRLLDEFAAFSREYVSLLGLVPETISRNSFVVNNGIEKLLQEWNMLSRASEQRLIRGLKEQFEEAPNSEKTYKERLEEASNLAKTYCDRWNAILQDGSYRKLEMPVVYFEKLFRISRSIYAPQIPVISIPLTDYDQPDNWQSLAHELSHHIFWNGFSADEISRAHQKLREGISGLFPPGAGSARSLRQREARVALWRNWLEEVFADVYGTLLDGSAYAISAQDRMAEQVDRLQDFLIADHQHPCVYLRPFISLYTLDFMAEQMPGKQAEVELLKKRWSDFSEPARQLRYKSLPLSTLAGDARKVVEMILRGDYWPVSFDSVNLLAVPKEGRAGILSLERVNDADPLTLEYPALDKVTLPTRFEVIKERLKEASTRFAQALGFKRPDEDARMLAWLALTGLELSDTRGYPVHGCTDDHRHLVGWWYQKHTHSQDGSDVLPC